MSGQSYLSLSCWDPKTSEQLNLEKKFPVISSSKEFKVHSCGWGHILGQRGSFPCVDSAFGLVILHMKPWSHQIKECVITVSSLHSFPWRFLLSWYICHIACQSLQQPASLCLPASFSQPQFTQAVTVWIPLGFLLWAYELSESSAIPV